MGFPLPGKDKRERYEWFFPFSYLHATLPASSGTFHLLVFQPNMESGVEWGSQLLLIGQISPRGALPPLQPWQQGASSGQQQRTGSICSQEVSARRAARVSSLSVPPGPTSSSPAETPLEQPGLGLAFHCSAHGCSCFRGIILTCWLLCQSVLPALQPCFQLCFAADCFTVQPIRWHHQKTAGAGAWAGSAHTSDLGSRGIACVHQPLRQLVLRQLNWSLCHTLETEDKELILHMVFSVWHGFIIFLSSSFAAF